MFYDPYPTIIVLLPIPIAALCVYIARVFPACDILPGFRPIAILLTAFWTVATSVIVFFVSYAYHVNEWAVMWFCPGTFVCFILAFAFLWLLYKRLVYAPILYVLPLCWFCAWLYLARPYGIWVWLHARPAYASLFVPQDAQTVQRHDPLRHCGATFEITYHSRSTLEQLLQFYRTTVNNAHLELLDVKETYDRDLHRYHIRWINKTGQVCDAFLDQHLGREQNDWRTVTLDCHFKGPFLNEPPSSL